MTGSNIKKNITVLIKPVNNCNLRCVYCYNADYQYEPFVLAYEVYSRILDIISKDYTNVNFVWLGGEPLLPGLDFYKQIAIIQSSFSGRLKISNTIQTNGTLLTLDFLNILYKEGFQLGFSYDGENNDRTRGDTKHTLESMELYAQKSGRTKSTIKVVIKDDLAHIVDVYEFYKKCNISVRLNPLVECSNTVNKGMLYSHEEYSNALCRLFDYWINDRLCNITVFPLLQYIDMLTGRKVKECAYSGCIGNYICIDPHGDIYPCSKYYTKDICLGNISKISNLNDVFENEAFLCIAERNADRQRRCRDECEWFDICHGGCSYDAQMTGDASGNGFFSCMVLKTVLRYITSKMNLYDIDKIGNCRVRRRVIKNMEMQHDGNI